MKFSVVDSATDTVIDYVYVNEDGTMRELTSDEAEYLATLFHPADGARPYVKEDYTSLTPAKKISGFLLRAKLPPHLREAGGSAQRRR